MFFFSVKGFTRRHATEKFGSEVRKEFKRLSSDWWNIAPCPEYRKFPTGTQSYKVVGKT